MNSQSLRDISSAITALFMAIALLGAIHLHETIAGADDPPAKAKSFRDRVVDRITLKDGTQLLGMGVSEKPAQLLLRTEWLRSTNGDFYNTHLKPLFGAQNKSRRSVLASELKNEISRLELLDPPQPLRIGLMKEVHDRLSTNEEEDPEFIIVEVPKSRLRKLDAQPAARRDICRLALLNSITDLEETHWKSVTAQLQAIPEAQRRRTPPVQLNEDRLDLDRIISAVDVQLNSATKLVQSGDQYFDETAKPDMSLMINSLLGGNLQSLLGELLNEGASAAKKSDVGNSLAEVAGKMADAQNHRTVVVSGFNFDLEAGSATVTRRLFRKTDEGKWTLLVSSEESSTAADLKPGQAEALQDDPQIKEIAKLVLGLGLGDGQLSNAMQMGAVVQNAMSKVTTTFDSDIQAVIATKRFSNTSGTPVVILAEANAEKVVP